MVRLISVTVKTILFFNSIFNNFLFQININASIYTERILKPPSNNSFISWLWNVNVIFELWLNTNETRKYWILCIDLIPGWTMKTGICRSTRDYNMLFWSRKQEYTRSICRHIIENLLFSIIFHSQINNKNANVSSIVSINISITSLESFW